MYRIIDITLFGREDLCILKYVGCLFLRVCPMPAVPRHLKLQRRAKFLIVRCRIHRVLGSYITHRADRVRRKSYLAVETLSFWLHFIGLFGAIAVYFVRVRLVLSLVDLPNAHSSLLWQLL